MSILFALLLYGGAATAIGKDPDWQVRRSATSGSCSLQRADTLPSLGTLLATRPTKVAACKAAAELKTDDPSDRQRCFDYTPNTVRLCQSEGTPLPR